MTRPRQVLPGKMYIVSRATQDRNLYLTPNSDGALALSIIFKFCIAMASMLSGVLVHAIDVMGNHIHLVVTDVEGKLPVFTHWLFRHSSLCVKELRGIDENVWAARKQTHVQILTKEAVIEAIAYTIANPTSAGLVESFEQWPGFVTRPEDLEGREEEVEIPKQFFNRKRQAQSHCVTLKITCPPCLLEGSVTAADIAETVRQRVAELEGAAIAERLREGKPFLGVEALANSDPMSHPETPRKKDGLSDGRVPLFKALDKEVLEQAYAELEEFWEAYDEALELLKAGKRPTFPAGTWHMCVHLKLPRFAPF